MRDEPMVRLLDYDRRRYWLENGWSIRFRVREAETSESRPHGIRYAFTLHDMDGTRLLGFDNAHGPQGEPHDHRHRFRKTAKTIPYEFADTDTLIADFFDAVKGACKAEGIPFDIVEEDLELEDGDEAQEPE